MAPRMMWTEDKKVKLLIAYIQTVHEKNKTSGQSVATMQEYEAVAAKLGTVTAEAVRQTLMKTLKQSVSLGDTTPERVIASPRKRINKVTTPRKRTKKAKEEEEPETPKEYVSSLGDIVSDNDNLEGPSDWLSTQFH